MSDVRFLMRAIDIGCLLGLHDRTITRWSLKGKVERKERGKYCLLSVFRYYREQLLKEIASLETKIEKAGDKSQEKSLKQQKLESSIEIITANAKIKEYEVETAKNNLVEGDEAELAYKAACAEFRRIALAIPTDVAEEIAGIEDPNLINNLLQQKIAELLYHLSSRFI